MPLNTGVFPTPLKPAASGFSFDRGTACPLASAHNPKTGHYGLESIGWRNCYALQQENRLRAELMAQVQAARDGGATFDELAALVAPVKGAAANLLVLVLD